MSKKKKVIALVVDTNMTNDDLERGEVELVIRRPDVETFQLAARNVRVLDSD